ATAVTMPYHLLPRVQKLKDALFPISYPVAQTSTSGSPQDIRDPVRRRSTPNQKPPLFSSRHAIPRLSNPYNEPAAGAAGIPRWLSVVFLLVAVMAVVWVIWAVCITYTHFLRPSPSARGSRYHQKKKYPDSESSAFELEYPNGGDWRGRDSLSLPNPSRSFSIAGSSKRRKSPPPSLDLEALRDGNTRGGRWWRGLSRVTQRKVNSYLSGKNTTMGYDGVEDDDDVDLGRRRESGSGYDINASARLLRDLGIGMSSAVATGGFLKTRTPNEPYKGQRIKMLPPTFPIIFILLRTTLAVDIHLHWEHRYASFHSLRDPITATCPSQPPGVCCIPHESIILADIHESLDDYLTSRITFSSLFHSQLGLPILHVAGTVNGEDVSGRRPDFGLLLPGSSDIDELDPGPGNIVFGASWVDLRTRFPASSDGNRYLAWQGVERMVWGMNSWSVASGGVPFPRLKRWGFGKWERRALGSRDVPGGIPMGEVVVKMPRRWRYASVYEVNGTVFKEEGDRSGGFKSQDGRVLDLRPGV
ncbi:MAG: hypothetical protein Q9186_006549, partial [Xanthomendoza sp. 1 TL-2023]